MKFLLALTLVFSSISLAQADSSVGCGLGTMIWKKNSIISALFRGTTNHSFSSQLFGITSGTSGCSQHSIVQREMYPVYFAEANLPELRYEMAVGKGEYLATFAEVLGCSTQARGEFMNWAKNEYSEIFNAQDLTPAQMLKNLGTQFKSTKQAQSCDNLALI